MAAARWCSAASTSGLLPGHSGTPRAFVSVTRSGKQVARCGFRGTRLALGHRREGSTRCRAKEDNQNEDDPYVNPFKGYSLDDNNELIYEEPEAEGKDGEGENPFEGLKLDDKGDLIDEKTGKALNDFGATRFDVAVRAMRGDIGGKFTGEESTEQQTGQILESLVRFPAPYTFQVVGKASEGFAQDMMQIVSDATGVPVAEFLPLTVKERGKGGKFLSLGITVVLQSAAQVQDVYEELGKDDRVMMKY
mmetsp:Transcript_38572/g.83880  ORF Transcript_38572/g.83880 Transcript_38572/m.83880 type:complete len:249 (-) Transcript_38572:73-819(-)